MDSYLMFLNCPAYISCPRGHHFNGPIDCLTVPEQPAATAASASPARSAGQSARPRDRWEEERS